MDAFELKLANVDVDHKALLDDGKRFIVGGGVRTYHSLDVVESIPEDCQSYVFELGSNSLPLIRAFGESGRASTALEVALGSSNEAYENEEFDYRECIKELAKYDFPVLSELRLGYYELYCNADELFGTVGNLSSLLSRCPNLKTLKVEGYFELSDPISLPKLLTLSIDDQFWSQIPDNPHVSQKSLDMLFAGHFPALEKLNVHLSSEPQPTQAMAWTLPGTNSDKSFWHQKFPSLKSIYVTGTFTLESIAALLNLPEPIEFLGDRSRISLPELPCFEYCFPHSGYPIRFRDPQPDEPNFETYRAEHAEFQQKWNACNQDLQRRLEELLIDLDDYCQREIMQKLRLHDDSDSAYRVLDRRFLLMASLLNHAPPFVVQLYDLYVREFPKREGYLWRTADVDRLAVCSINWPH